LTQIGTIDIVHGAMINCGGRESRSHNAKSWHDVTKIWISQELSDKF